MNPADEIRQLKSDYGLTTADIAKIMDVSVITVNRYLLAWPSRHKEPVPAGRLRLLKMVLRSRKKL